MAKKRDTTKIGNLFGEVADDDLQIDLSPDNSEQLHELQEEIERLKSASIVKVDERRWTFNRFQMTPTQLIVPQDIDEVEVYELGHALGSMSGAINFWIGDFTNLFLSDAEAQKGEPLSEAERNNVYQAIVDRFSMSSLRSLRQYASVCRILPPSNRLDSVSYTHHQIIAFLPEDLKGREAEFLQRCAEEDLSKRELEALIASERARALPKKQSTPSVFRKDRVPRVTSSFQKTWEKAREGDDAARAKVYGQIAVWRDWLDEVENELK